MDFKEYDFEALKATVENRPHTHKYMRTAEGYQKSVSFDKNNIPPNPIMIGGLKVNFGTTPERYNLEVLSAFLKSNRDIGIEERKWLANLFSEIGDYEYQLSISRRNRQGRPESSRTKHWYAVQEYKDLIGSGTSESKAKEKIVKSYDLTQEELNAAITAYDDEQLKKAGLEPKKRKRGRPKKSK